MTKGLWSFQDRTTFAFLRICHDVHREIAFLPLARNASFFTHHPLGSRFWKKLSMRQKEHVQRLSVVLITKSSAGNKFVNRHPNIRKKEGFVAEFNFLRVLCGLTHKKIVGVPGHDSTDQMAQQEAEPTISEGRSPAVEGINIGTVRGEDLWS